MARDITPEQWADHQQDLRDTKKPASFRLSVHSQAQLALIAQHMGRSKTDTLEMAIDLLHSEICTADTKRSLLIKAVGLLQRLA
tara:strand:+ start:733 stop:984 length:252 start_codon:yes stop_codon:yes gene_type:complete